MSEYSYVHAHCVWPKKQINVDVDPTKVPGITGDFQDVRISFISSVRLKRKRKYYKVITKTEVMFVTTFDGERSILDFLRHYKQGLDRFEHECQQVKYLWMVPEDLAKFIEDDRVRIDKSHLSNKEMFLLKFQKIQID